MRSLNSDCKASPMLLGRASNMSESTLPEVGDGEEAAVDPIFAAVVVFAAALPLVPCWTDPLTFWAFEDRPDVEFTLMVFLERLW